MHLPWNEKAISPGMKRSRLEKENVGSMRKNISLKDDLYATYPRKEVFESK